MVKIGVSTYSLSSAICAGEMDVLGAIERIAELGAEHVEVVPIGFSLSDNPALVDAIRKKAADLKLDVSNYAIGADFADMDADSFEAEVQRVMGEVEIASRLGVKLMRHDAATSPDVSIRHFNAVLPRLAEACRRVADHAARFGIITSVENHGHFVQASDRVQALIHAVGRDNFRTTLDVGNFMCVDEDPVAAVGRNMPYASMVHLKDFYLRRSPLDPGEGWTRTASGNYLRGAILGHGDVDMRGVLAGIARAGYDGYLSLEFEGLEECQLGVRIGLANARRLWAEVRASSTDG